jgi:outer membrane receptor protein involved in Fe transport
MRTHVWRCALIGLAFLGSGWTEARAQGVTTAAVGGSVTSADGTALQGATVTATHVPSGTRYQSMTRTDGRYTIPGMRVGGPYTIGVAYIGFETLNQQIVSLGLGVMTDLDFVLRESALVLDAIDVTAQRSAILSSDRTGAATSISRESIETLPTVSRRIEDFARLTPQYSGSGFGFSFAGVDNRLNNVMVDGSYFNNSFGLSGQPGDRTNVAPISMDAIEQIQVNIAPFDVRQGNFVGAGVNTVTRSGGNEFRGSVYTQLRNENFVGTDAGGNAYDPGKFRYNQIGGWFSGPIVQNRLFFFLSYEQDELTQPGISFRANSGTETVGGNTTRVLRSDLDEISTFLRSNFNYETGPYEGYDHSTPATRFLGKIDYNVNDRNKLSLRYTHLDSNTDVLLSTSSSLGVGRSRNTSFLSFQNSNYQIMENIRSVVAEWNSLFRGNMSNNLILGYTSQDESRDSRGTLFPFVDIREAGTTYTSFGFEPFTPRNQLRYNSFQLLNNFSIHLPQHTLTFGASLERYRSENVFFPGSQSAYVYNSLDDFFRDARGYVADPNRTVGTVAYDRFQVRFSNIEGLEEPVQPLEVLYAGIYAQDEWQITSNLRVTGGLRLDAPWFGDTGFENADANSMTFRNADGSAYRLQTQSLPGANLLFSPRLGFNWDVRGDRTTQVRGGTGVFAGRPAYVWISNQIGENGMLTGFADIRGAATLTRPFNPNPDHYKPAPTGNPAASYALAFTDPDFKFPQVWRNNVAIDQQLPWGLIGTGEFLYSRDVNGISYINANLPEAQAAFGGVDARPRWTANRINNATGRQVTSAIVLQNQAEGYSWNLATSLEKPFSSGLFVKTAYSYGEAKNTVDPGSIAIGSWQNNAHAGDPNNPGLGYAATSPGHRFFTALSYRRQFLPVGPTSISFFYEGRTINNTSYIYAADANGDGGTNDLIYIPRNTSEMRFVQYTQGASGTAGQPGFVPARTFTVQEQEAAWQAYIEQDKYLRANRGQYAERNAVFLPMIWRADLSISQDLARMVGGRRNGVQVRADILNVTNLLNSDWGIGQRIVTNQPLVSPSRNTTTNELTYRLRNVRAGDEWQLLQAKTFEPTASVGDVWRMQLSLRYTFN